MNYVWVDALTRKEVICVNVPQGTRFSRMDGLALVCFFL